VRADAIAVEVAGRANLIGEYTDFNGGLVLPIALDGLTLRVAGVRHDGDVTLTSEAGLAEPYVDAAVRALRDVGRPVRGVHGNIAGTLPPGAGLSSSAALTVAIVLAIDGGEPALEPASLARICQRAENVYVGVPCGIMDQLAVVCGRPGHALLIDCHDLSMRQVRVPDDLTVLVVHSGLERQLANGSYAQLREECQQAARRLGASQLCEVSVEQLDDALAALPDTLARRTRHVVTENARVDAFAKALAADDRKTMGAILAASHRSLGADLGVSTPELDLLADELRLLPGTVGARLTGAGFGGCLVALSDAHPSADRMRDLRERYRAKTGQKLRYWITRPGAGVVAGA
jgi:galactokinase